MSAVKAASHTNKMAAAVKPLTTAKPKRAAIRPTEERAKAPTEMRVLLTWTGIFLELIRRTTRSLTFALSGRRSRPLQQKVSRAVGYYGTTGKCFSTHVASAKPAGRDMARKPNSARKGAPTRNRRESVRSSRGARTNAGPTTNSRRPANSTVSKASIAARRPPRMPRNTM